MTGSITTEDAPEICDADYDALVRENARAGSAVPASGPRRFARRSGSARAPTLGARQGRRMRGRC